MIIVYKDWVELLIDNPQEGKQNNVLAYEFKVEQKHFD